MRNDPSDCNITHRFVLCWSAALVILVASQAWAQHDGKLLRDGQKLFPLGCYELPKDEGHLKAMADAGINLIVCHNKEDLDRVQSAGMLGVMPLSLAQGATDALREQIQAVVDHPALAAWEGPDEVVWNFTACSGLYRQLKVHRTSGEWWLQTPEARKYAEEQAQKIIPNMRQAAELVRELDPRKRPIWINEAQHSDVGYVRQYLDFVDVTGCDIYPVHANDRPVSKIGTSTERWKQTGRGKPVWMVLQAFSWHELGDDYGHQQPAYPTFAQSRFMAYDAIVHGAGGILYWGSQYLKSEECRQSVYALTSELAQLQPFLVAPDFPGTTVKVIEVRRPDTTINVSAVVRRAGDQWLVAVVNDDAEPRMGVVIEGLDALEGRTLDVLYSDETATVRHGELIARVQPLEAKLFATGRQWESPRREGREFGG
jgi:hypothetical protein